jgi:hypothetical protein
MTRKDSSNRRLCYRDVQPTAHLAIQFFLKWVLVREILGQILWISTIVLTISGVSPSGSVTI